MSIRSVSNPSENSVVVTVDDDDNANGGDDGDDMTAPLPSRPPTMSWWSASEARQRKLRYKIQCSHLIHF